MIERTNSFKVGNQSFLTLEDAQKFELDVFFGSNDVVDKILKNKDKIIDILTTTPTSLPVYCVF